jgi:hypothetical protein
VKGSLTFARGSKLCWVEILRCITAAHTLNKSLLVNAAIITHSLPEPAVAQLPQAQRIEKISDIYHHSEHTQLTAESHDSAVFIIFQRSSDEQF